MSAVLGLNIVLILNIRIFSNMAVFTSHEMSWQFFLYMEGNVFIYRYSLSHSKSGTQGLFPTLSGPRGILTCFPVGPK